jgi:hypothetical protein
MPPRGTKQSRPIPRRKGKLHEDGSYETVDGKVYDGETGRTRKKPPIQQRITKIVGREV